MKVLIVGSGGREHALAWSCSRSGIKPQITVTPGNGGTTTIARNVDIPSEDISQIEDFVRSERFDLTIIGPEAPAIAGLGDRLTSRGFRVFGPSSNAARIEGSKAFAKKLMVEEGIPTSPFEIFTDKAKADSFIKSNGAPVVVKASGIAAGKGAIVCESISEALAATKLIFEDRAFGSAGDEVVVESFADGREVSMMALVDGTDFLLLPSSRDHKRVFDGDKGPNTGGMGAYAPVKDVPPELFKRFAKEILPRLLNGLARKDAPFRGAIYPGLMVDGHRFNVLEVNARFGDPETQAILPLLNFDLLEAMAEIAEGSFASWLNRNKLNSLNYLSLCKSGAAATVVAAAPGYPGKYPRDIPISRLPQESDNLIPFHAGTIKTNAGFKTSGGRVLAITGLGKDIDEALDVAYNGMEQVKFDGINYRRDIGRHN